MSDQFVAEIRIFPFDFAPAGWAFCNGQVLPISQNTALFSLLGTFYGGNGASNFALPNMQGNAPINFGQGPGLSPYNVGQTGGSETVTLLESQLAGHNHPLEVDSSPATLNEPAPDMALARSFGASAYQSSDAGLVPLSANAIAATGGSQPHNNLMPYLTLNFCIALVGIFPSRS